jgi:hypothetical protein
MIVLVARKKTYGSFQIGGEVLSYNRVVVVGGWCVVRGGERRRRTTTRVRNALETQAADYVYN